MRIDLKTSGQLQGACRVPLLPRESSNAPLNLPLNNWRTLLNPISRKNSVPLFVSGSGRWKLRKYDRWISNTLLTSFDRLLAAAAAAHQNWTSTQFFAYRVTLQTSRWLTLGQIKEIEHRGAQCSKFILAYLSADVNQLNSPISPKQSRATSPETAPVDKLIRECFSSSSENCWD